VYGVSAVFLLAATVFTGMIARPDLQVSREPTSIRSVLAGFTFLWQHKVALGAISLDLFAVLLGSVTALMPMFAKDVLDTGPWGLGLLRSSPAIGALVVAIWLARNPLNGRVGRKMFIAVAIYGATMLVFGHSTT